VSVEQLDLPVTTHPEQQPGKLRPRAMLTGYHHGILFAVPGGNQGPPDGRQGAVDRTGDMTGFEFEAAAHIEKQRRMTCPDQPFQFLSGQA
jgi:hypothetical protein